MGVCDNKMNELLHESTACFDQVDQGQELCSHMIVKLVGSLLEYHSCSLSGATQNTASDNTIRAQRSQCTACGCTPHMLCVI